MSREIREVTADHIVPSSVDTSSRGFYNETLQPASFTEYFHRRDGMPWWVDTVNGSKFLTAMHTVWMDLAYDVMTTGANVACAFTVMPAPPLDGLAAVAEERLDSYRYLHETKRAWVKRLTNAWDDFALMGSVPGLIRQLELAGYTARVQRDYTAWPEGNNGAPPLVTTAVAEQAFQFVLVVGVQQTKVPQIPRWGGGLSPAGLCDPREFGRPDRPRFGRPDPAEFGRPDPSYMNTSPGFPQV